MLEKPRYVPMIKKSHAKSAKFMDSENLTLMILDTLVYCTMCFSKSKTNL